MNLPSSLDYQTDRQIHSSKKQVVAVYIEHYLTVSMTFIYRQLKGISDSFDPIVLAASVDNLDLFPFNPIYLKKRTFIEEIYCKFYRKFFRHFAVSSPFQVNYWKNILRKKNVGLIHAHFGPSGLEILPIAKALRIPLIVSFHGYDASKLLRNRKYISELKGLFNYAHVITVSETMAEKLKTPVAHPSKTDILYYGIPIDDFHYVERIPVREKVKRGETLQFLQVSNFVEKKGHKYTIMAFRDFLSRYPNSRLTLAGDGPLRLQIEALCIELGIQERVEFPGKVSKAQVIPLMAQADIFLHHSVTAENGDQEGIPNAIMEAMATGLIVISTFHSGIPELINDNKNGYLVEERDVRSYKNKMVEVLDCGLNIGQNAFNTVNEKFNIAVQNSKLKDVYRKVIDEWNP